MRNAILSFCFVATTLGAGSTLAQVTNPGNTWMGDWSDGYIGFSSSINGWEFDPLPTNGTPAGVMNVRLKNSTTIADLKIEAGVQFLTVSGFRTLRTGALPVRVYAPHIAWNFALGQDSSQVSQPVTTFEMGSTFWKLDDKNSTGVWELGDDLFDPFLQSNQMIASISGTESNSFSGDKLFGGDAILQPNTLYVLETKMLLQSTLLDGQFAPGLQVEYFSPQLEWNMGYETSVPEPASMAALGAGALMLLRRRTR